MDSDEVLILFRNIRAEPFPKYLPFSFIEIPAVSLIREYVSTIGKKPCDKFCLVFDNVTIMGFTLLQCFFGLPATDGSSDFMPEFQELRRRFAPFLGVKIS